jgi:hypothetical protein
MNRTDTIDSTLSDSASDYPRSGTASNTPGTSTSSLSQCPLPTSTPYSRFPYFMLTLSSTSTLSFIALPLHLRTAVIDAVNAAWKRGISKMGQVEYKPELMRKHKEAGCEGAVWEITLKGDAWMPKSEERVS